MDILLSEIRLLREKVDDIEKKIDTQINALAHVESILLANGDSSSGIKGGRRKKQRMRSPHPGVFSEGATERVQQQLKSASTTKLKAQEKNFKLTDKETDLITLLTDVDEDPKEVFEVNTVDMPPPKSINRVVTPRSHVITTISHPPHRIKPTQKAPTGTNSKGNLVAIGSTARFRTPHMLSNGNASSTVPPKNNHRSTLVETLSTQLHLQAAAPRGKILSGKKVNHDVASLVELSFTFKPVPEMNLRKEHEKIGAYIFCSSLDGEEDIIKHGDCRISRAQLTCMCPGHEISEEVFTLMVIRTTHEQSNKRILWSLPPLFAEDIFRDKTLDDLLRDYGKDFMQPNKNIKWVYIPVKEKVGHWYLIVFSIVDKVTYYFDVLSPKHGEEQRLQNMKVIEQVLVQIILSEDYVKHGMPGKDHFEKWDILRGYGLPQLESSENSACWVMQWLNMESHFTPSVLGVLKDEKVRMSSTLKLVLSESNERKRDVQISTDRWWNAVVAKN
ncbi:hypothetical protein S83_064404 [Arachis hypogaea]